MWGRDEKKRSKREEKTYKGRGKVVWKEKKILRRTARARASHATALLLSIRALFSFFLGDHFLRALLL